jgi:hemolysin activation/secretion protein
VLAQTPATKYVGRPIEKVRLLVEDAPNTEPSLIDLLQIREGQPFSVASIRESIAHLHGLGRFQDVQVDATDAPGGGVLLSFNLIPVHGVQRVQFAGNLELSERLLRRTVTDRYGATPPIGRAEDAARTLEQLYSDHGYLRAKVEPVPEVFHNPDRTRLTFTIQPGPLARIRKATIAGDAREPRHQLLRRLDAAEGEPYRRPELQRNLSGTRSAPRRGFIRCSLARAMESEDGASVDPCSTSGRPSGRSVRRRPLPVERRNEMVPLEREDP